MFENEHQLAKKYYHLFCTDIITDIVLKGFFYNCFYRNEGVNPIEELDKLTKLFDEYDLKKREWTGFAVENISVHDWFKYNVKHCFLFSTVNCGDIKNIIKFFSRNSEKNGAST